MLILGYKVGSAEKLEANRVKRRLTYLTEKSDTDIMVF